MKPSFFIIGAGLSVASTIAIVLATIPAQAQQPESKSETIEQPSDTRALYTYLWSL